MHNKRIPTAFITFYRAEGTISECVRRTCMGRAAVVKTDYPTVMHTTEALQGHVEAVAVTLVESPWEQAERVLREWSYTAPKDGSYHKCDVLIAWWDKTTYSIRYDLRHPSVEGVHLAELMRGTLRFAAERLHPAQLTPNQYMGVLRHNAREARRIAEMLLDDYEIPE